MADRPTPETTRRAALPCRLIRLADGAEWCFLRPSARLIPRVLAETDSMGRRVERVAVDLKFGYPNSVESLINQLSDACENRSAVEQYEAFFSLASELVLQVHDVDLQTICGLLAVKEDELSDLVHEVISVISETESRPAANPPKVS